VCLVLWEQFDLDLCNNCDKLWSDDDEDIATNDTSTPTLVSTSPTPLGPITRARARRLTHQVSSLLSSGSSYLDNWDTCTLVLLRNNGLDPKGRGITQAGFGLQDRHDLWQPPRLHTDSILFIQLLHQKLIKYTSQGIQNHLHICSKSTAIVDLLQSPFSHGAVSPYFGPMGCVSSWVRFRHVLGLEHDPSTLVVVLLLLDNL
jgi:hypothetical protein